MSKECGKPQIPDREKAQSFTQRVTDAFKPRVDKTGTGDVIVTVWSPRMETSDGKTVRSVSQTPTIPGIIPSHTDKLR